MQMLTRRSNSSLLECSHPTVEARVQFPAEIHVSLGTTSLGWRWPWSNLSIVVTPTWSILLDSEYETFKFLTSIFRVEWLSIAIRPTSYISLGTPVYRTELTMVKSLHKKLLRKVCINLVNWWSEYRCTVHDASSYKTFFIIKHFVMRDDLQKDHKHSADHKKIFCRSQAFFL